MKKLLCLLIISVLFFSCKKSKEEDPFVLQFQKVLEKYMICDSIKTTVYTVSNIQKLGKGRGEDLMFHKDATYTKYSSPGVNKIFQLESPDKIYYYTDELVTSDYFKVPSISDSKLVLLRADTVGKSTTFYFTAE